MTTYQPPTTGLEDTPPNMSTPDAQNFRDDRDAILDTVLGQTPSPDQTQPLAQDAFRADKAAAIQHLRHKQGQLRQALKAAAPPTANQPTAPVGNQAPGQGQQQAPALQQGAPAAVVGVQPVAGGLQYPVQAPIPQANRRTGGKDTTYQPPIAWTGGGEIAATRRTGPKSLRALRPSDYKAQVKVTKDCTTPLLENYHLGTPEQIGKDSYAGVTFQQWTEKIKEECEERGLDHVFRITVDANTEYYLFDRIGKAKSAVVNPWVQGLKNRNPVDPYDTQALDWTAKFLLASLTVDMQTRVGRDVELGASGPEVFAAIVNIHQSLTVSAGRKLIAKLDNLSITKEPGEDVETFGNKVLDLAKRIEGTGQDPPDFYVLIYKAFQGVSNDIFQHQARDLYAKADEGDTSVNNYIEIIAKLKTTYRHQKDQGLWEAAKHQKEVQVLKAEVHKLRQVVGGGGRRQGANSAAEVTCYHCGKPGHIKPNCPDKDKPPVTTAGAPTANSDANRTTATKPKGPNKIPPGKDEPESRKTSDGSEERWCAKCKKWTSGGKLHGTAQHKKKKKDANPSGNLAEVSATDSSATVSGGLRFVGGYHGEIYDEGELERQKRLKDALDNLSSPISEDDLPNEMFYRHVVILLNRPSQYDHIDTVDHPEFLDMLEDLRFDRASDRYNEQAEAKTLTYLSEDIENRDPDLDEMEWTPITEARKQRLTESNEWKLVERRRRKKAPPVDCCGSPPKKSHLNFSAGQC